MGFLVLGIFALSHMVSPVVLKLVPSALPVIPFHLQFTQGEGDARESVVDYQFNTHDLVCLGLCSVVGVWYILKKHWLANDLLGMAFAINGVELLHLNNVVTGCILLGGLFFYDIFWVFGTDVMVTVAKSFEAPIKLVFPQDLLENGPMGATNFAMLGLGDIVIPGIFIALLLRYDNSLKRNSNFYFTPGNLLSTISLTPMIWCAWASAPWLVFGTSLRSTGWRTTCLAWPLPSTESSCST